MRISQTSIIQTPENIRTHSNAVNTHCEHPGNICQMQGDMLNFTKPFNAMLYEKAITESKY